jgi:hypothetical protein
MRRPRTLLALLLLARPAICAESDAQKMAEVLTSILKDYCAQVDKKIAAEKEAYEAAAKLYASAEDQRVFLGLTTDRLFNAKSRAAWLADGTLSINKLLFDELPAYSKRDFDNTRQVFDNRFDSYKTYLANLQDLTIERTKADALLKALKDLSTKTSLSDLIANLKNYGDTTSKQLQYSDCALSVARFSVYQGQQKRLQDSLNAAGLSDDAKQQMNADLKSVTTRVTSLQSDLKTLKAAGVYDDQKSTCKSPQ